MLLMLTAKQVPIYVSTATSRAWFGRFIGLRRLVGLCQVSGALDGARLEGDTDQG
jgi:hypothetical protein